MTLADLKAKVGELFSSVTCLATSSVVMGLTYMFGPPIPGITVLAALCAVIGIGVMFTLLNGKSKGRKATWAVCAGVAFVLFLALYAACARQFIYQTDPIAWNDGTTTTERRIRGFVPANAEKATYIEKCGSIDEAL